MASFDYSTASPLVTTLLAKWDFYSKLSQQQGTAIANSACAPWVDIPDINDAVGDLGDAIEALTDYITTLAPG